MACFQRVAALEHRSVETRNFFMKNHLRVVSDTALARPDGRPLYRYPLSPDTFSDLQEELRLEVASGRTTDLSAPAFVLWAAEHIRARFSGGALSWQFVLGPLGLPYDDQVLGESLRVGACLGGAERSGGLIAAFGCFFTACLLRAESQRSFSRSRGSTAMS